MPAHRRARLRHRPGADGPQDVAMLALEGLAIGAPGQPRAAADSLTRDDEAAEMLEQAAELRIAGGVRNAAVERKVLVDAILAALDRCLDGVEAFRDLSKLGGGGALGGKPCCLGLDAGAQLQHREHLAQGGELLHIDAERPACIGGDEGADALPRHDQAFCAQRRHGFPYHGTADAGGRDHLLLGRQSRARWNLAAGDVGGQPRDQFMRQRSRLRQWRGRRKQGRSRHRLSHLGRWSMLLGALDTSRARRMIEVII